MSAPRTITTAELHEVALYEKLPGSRTQCHICLWRCSISPGKMGVCRMRRNDDGVLHVLNYASASSVAVDPIEKKPLFHFFPGTRVFSMGSWGCNFHCKHCQNWQISCVEEPEEPFRSPQQISAGQAIELTRSHGCPGIAWTYNEPTIWFEYTLDCARLARQSGLYTVYVTNGYMTPEALDLIGPYLDSWRVDIKGFSADLYRGLARVSHWKGILEVAERARKKWGMHVEVVTNIIPNLNDDEEQLTGIANWIRDGLGPLTPWHVTRFYPQYQLRDKPPTPAGTLDRAAEIGAKAGLRFIYKGNVAGVEQDTICYNCGNLIISRAGYATRILGLKGGSCKFCGADMNMRVPPSDTSTATGEDKV